MIHLDPFEIGPCLSSAQTVGQGEGMDFYSAAMNDAGASGPQAMRCTSCVVRAGFVHRQDENWEMAGFCPQNKERPNFH